MAELTPEQKAAQEAASKAEKANEQKAGEFAEACKKPGRYIVDGGRLVGGNNKSILGKDGEPLIQPK